MALVTFSCLYFTFVPDLLFNGVIVDDEDGISEDVVNGDLEVVEHNVVNGTVEEDKAEGEFTSLLNSASVLLLMVI